MVQILCKTVNGKVFKCNKCNKIHVEYKNLSFNLSNRQYADFANVLLELDGEEWEEKNKNSYYSRKIMIPTGNKNICFLLNSQELDELRDMLTNNTKQNPCLTNIFNNHFSLIAHKN